MKSSQIDLSSPEVSHPVTPGEKVYNLWLLTEGGRRLSYIGPPFHGCLGEPRPICPPEAGSHKWWNCVRLSIPIKLKRGDNIVDIIYDFVRTLTITGQAALDMAITTSKLDGARERGYRLARIDWNVSLATDQNEGPLIFGLAKGAVDTAAEIETVVEEDPQDAVGMVAMLNKFSYVKALGVLQTKAGAFVTQVPDSGLFEKTVLNISVPEGDELVYWVYNGGVAAFGTGVFFMNAVHYGVWLND